MLGTVRNWVLSFSSPIASVLVGIIDVALPFTELRRIGIFKAYALSLLENIVQLKTV